MHWTFLGTYWWRHIQTASAAILPQRTNTISNICLSVYTNDARMQLKTNKYTPVVTGASCWRNLIYNYSLYLLFVQSNAYSLVQWCTKTNNYYVLPHNMLFKIVNLSRCSATGLWLMCSCCTAKKLCNVVYSAWTLLAAGRYAEIAECTDSAVFP